MPTILEVTEAALYVDDLERALQFYTALFDRPVIRRTNRFATLRLTESQVLILFVRGASLEPAILNGGTIPAHDGSGPLHLCFGIGAGEIPAWEEHLRRLEITIEGRMTWTSGAQSLYFRDPDRHMLEVATPGVWD
jgi:catechol 2,3-dioxygenase-like lactoylglutathione lyase family enzyme